MSAIQVRPVLLCSVLTLTLGCTSSARKLPDPKTLPYQFEKSLTLGKQVVCADLDHDGRDEIFSVNPYRDPPGGGSIIIFTSEFRTVDQVNFAGRLGTPQFLDWDGDGVSEILVPFVRHDSLFVSVVNAQGKKLRLLFLVSGKPRREDNGLLPWDPDVLNFFLIDTDGDGRPELVTLVTTGFARLPRGLLIHSLPGGRLVGQKIIGAMPDESFVGDFDSDGRTEIVIRTVAPNNGAVAGGFDDRHSYIISFELGLPPRVDYWRQMAGTWTIPSLFYADVDGDGKNEFLAFTTTLSARPVAARLELIEPEGWRTTLQRFISEPLMAPQIADLDGDGRPEILALRRPDQIWVFNGRFHVVRRRRLPLEPAFIKILPDADGDGIAEIAAISATHTLVLGPDLRVKALLSASVVGVQRRGIGNPPYILAQNGDETVAWRIVLNRWWFVHRYKGRLIWLSSVSPRLTVRVRLSPATPFPASVPGLRAGGRFSGTMAAKAGRPPFPAAGTALAVPGRDRGRVKTWLADFSATMRLSDAEILTGSVSAGARSIIATPIDKARPVANQSSRKETPDAGETDL